MELLHRMTEYSSLLIHEVYHGWPKVHSDCHPLLLDYWNFRDEISLEDGLLFKEHRLIIPESLRGKVLQMIHEGHYGVEKSQPERQSSGLGKHYLLVADYYSRFPVIRRLSGLNNTVCHRSIEVNLFRIWNSNYSYV